MKRRRPFKSGFGAGPTGAWRIRGRARSGVTNPRAGQSPGRVGRGGLKGCARGSLAVRLPPPPFLRAALSRGCAGSAARETKRRRRHRRCHRAGPGPWPGRPPALRLPFRRRHCRPRPGCEVRPAWSGDLREDLQRGRTGQGSGRRGPRGPARVWRAL